MDNVQDQKTADVVVQEQPKQESFWDKKSSTWLTGCCIVPIALVALFFLVTMLIGAFA